MDLRSFVKTALLDIVAGVSDAQQEAQSGVIVPRVGSSSSNFVKLGVTPIQRVEFEVSVTAEETKGSEGKIGVVNSFIGAGVSGKSAKEEGSASVIRFSVPVRFPLRE